MFTYPREINLSADTLNEFKIYLDTELLRHFAERADFQADLLRWQKDYWAKPSSEKKRFPYVGASNIIIPLTAIAIEAIHARIITTAFALDQFVELKLADAFDDIDRDLELYLDTELIKGCDIYKAATDLGLEFAKFGTCVGKTGFVKEIRSAVRNVGGEEQEFDVVRQGSTIDAVPLANFKMPFSERDPQYSTWCGEEHTESPHQILTKENAGFFKKGTYESLKNWVVQTQPLSVSAGYRQEMEKLQNMQINWPSVITWDEIWLSYDVDGSGKPKEIVCYYHQPSRTIMSLRYNWFEDLRRPYRIERYFPVEHRWPGIGVCKQNEQFQRAVTTQHRQRLDNATLANMRMIKVNKSSGYGPNEPIFPGKMWLVDNKDDIETFQLGEVYPSSYNNETAIVQYAQQRTGVNELSLGMPQAGTPGTATSDLTRVQEGSRKFDLTYKNFKRLLRGLSLDTVLNIRQFGFRDTAMLDLMPNGEKVKGFFMLPLNYIKNEAVFQLELAGQNQNKVLNRQNWMQLAQIFQQYYGGMLQLAQQSQNPGAMQQIAQQAMSAATDAFRQICETYDVRNIDRLLISIQPPQMLQQLAGQQAPQQGQQNPTQAPQQQLQNGPPPQAIPARM